MRNFNRIKSLFDVMCPGVDFPTAILPLRYGFSRERTENKKILQ
ncbi:MAG: hypothetical protein WBA41_17135 [Rivularia sp. (in: cyanobacteria)]